MTVAPLESLYSIKTLAHLPPAPSQPIKEDCGLLLCIGFVQCDCCVTCHSCFLSTFPQCPESFSLVIERGKKTLKPFYSHSYGEFSWIFLRCKLWIHTLIFCSHEQPGQETVICKKMGHLGIQFCGSLHFAGRLRSALSRLRCASHSCSALLGVWVTYC